MTFIYLSQILLDTIILLRRGSQGALSRNYLLKTKEVPGPALDPEDKDLNIHRMKEQPAEPLLAKEI